MRQVDLATEDELSEAVGTRLLAEPPGIDLGLLFRRNGNGYLRSRLKAFSEIARFRPVLLMTDLDTAQCPPALRRDWLKGRKTPNLLLRVAVREVESWLLADHTGMLELLGPSARLHLVDNPDGLPDPKSRLLLLAQRASREVRLDLCGPPGSVARQGLGYNARLCAFVKDHWSPARAALNSDSLRRARHRIAELAG